MKNLSKAADRMHIASKFWETPNQHASNGHSELRNFECEIDIGQVLERIKIQDMVVRPACPNDACTLRARVLRHSRMAIAF